MFFLPEAKPCFYNIQIKTWTDYKDWNVKGESVKIEAKVMR